MDFPSRILAVLLAAAFVVAVPSIASASTMEGSWSMEDCHGLAALALAPMEDVQASLPDGYEAEDAAAFLGAEVPAETFGLVGVEMWDCASVTVGGVTQSDALYGSTAAVIKPPEDAPGATMYFYKYGNFFDHASHVTQSERLGAPAERATSSIERTVTGAEGTVTLRSGGTYTLATADLAGMDDGSFQEWHEGERGTSHWQAGFTLAEGHQGTGTVTAPSGSIAARVMGGTEGEGLGIHAVSTFRGSITLED